MLKAGLIGAVIGFVYITSLSLISPFCTLCLTPLLGIGIGYLANRFDTPANVEASLGRGAIAGAMTGFAALLGQMLAAVINAGDELVGTADSFQGVGLYPSSGYRRVLANDPHRQLFLQPVEPGDHCRVRGRGGLNLVSATE
jgi:hypothetical protein